MQQSKTDWTPVLLLGLMANAMLRSRTGYWSRPGLLLAGISALVLAAAAALFSYGWNHGRWTILRWLLCALLASSSVLEILRLRSLYESLYPGTMGLAATCFVLLFPVIYLRREPSLRQTSGAVLSLLLVGLAVMLISIAPRLSVTNLQITALTAQDWRDAATAQLVLYPEYLLLGILPRQSDSRAPALRLSVAAVFFEAGIHFLLELFFGAAMPGRSSPVQAAAQCGALSIFNRLEWLQLILWSMAVSVKLAVYLYAMVVLPGGEPGSGNTAVGLDRFFWYLAGALVFCVLWRNVNLEQAFLWRNLLVWLFALPVLLGGICQWLFACKKKPA